jgi:hypothetical protein
MTLADQIAALDEAPTDDLIAQYTRLHGKGPRTRNRSWLVARVAWKIQEEALGGLSPAATKRLDELIAQLDGPLAPGASTARAAAPRPPRRTTGPATGTVLTKTWRGRDIRVHVREDGFEYESEVYRSLTAVAKAVTGAHWSGALFFGLRKRKPKGAS